MGPGFGGSRRWWGMSTTSSRCAIGSGIATCPPVRPGLWLRRLRQPRRPDALPIAVGPLSFVVVAHETGHNFRPRTRTTAVRPGRVRAGYWRVPDAQVCTTRAGAKPHHLCDGGSSTRPPTSIRSRWPTRAGAEGACSLEACSWDPARKAGAGGTPSLAISYTPGTLHSTRRCPQASPARCSCHPRCCSTPLQGRRAGARTASSWCRQPCPGGGALPLPSPSACRRAGGLRAGVVQGHGPRLRCDERRALRAHRALSRAGRNRTWTARAPTP